MHCRYTNGYISSIYSLTLLALQGTVSHCLAK
jgi:hypothetical protein